MERWNEVGTSKDDDSETELLLTVSVTTVEERYPVEIFNLFLNDDDTATQRLVFPDAKRRRRVAAAFSVTLLSTPPEQRRAVHVRAAS